MDEREKLVENDEGKKVKATVRKFASAHDLRRAFGFRWSMRGLPAVLQQLMRHEDIGTTMKYYVGQNAEVMAGAMRAATGSALGSANPSATSSNSKNPANYSGDDRS